MAVSKVMASRSPANIFHTYVLTNLQYWRDYVTAGLTDTPALDRGRNRIIKGISFALELEEAWPFIRELIETFAPYMERSGYWETWNWVLTQALAVVQRSQDRAGMVMLSALLARLAQRQSDFKKATTYYRRTIRLACQIGDRYNEARACSNLGFLYTEQGHWWRAEVLGCHALAIFEQLDSHHGRAHTENHLGFLYTRQRLWEQARQHLERACALWQAMDDNYGLMRGFINLGMLYVDMEWPDEALLYLEKALHQAQLAGEVAEIGMIYTNIGIVYNLRREPTQAEAYLWQAEAIFRRFSNSLGLALTWDNLGLVCLNQGKYVEAIQHLETAMGIWRNLNNKYGETRTMLYMAKCELTRGNRQKATEQLDEVERLIKQYGQEGQFHHLQPILMEYRRSLAEE